MRLIEHLRALGHSNRQAKQLLSTGKVFEFDAPVADPSRTVDPENVSIRENAPRIRVGVDLAIVHRDDHLVVVVKPSGMLSVPAASQRGAANVIGQVRRLFGEAHAVHRIDQETSGLLVVARNEDAQLRLKDLFFNHTIERRYHAIVAGHFPAGSHRIESTLLRDRGDGKRGSAEAPTTEGKQAVTTIALVETLGPSASLIEATLETGRTHQVRIHAAEKGHPVLGDSIYAGHDLAEYGANRDSKRRGPRNPAQAAAGHSRLALHAYALGFRHPFGGKDLRFVAPLADDLDRLARTRKTPRQRPHRR